MTARRRFLAFNAVGAAGIGVQLGVVTFLAAMMAVDYRLATGIGVTSAIAHNFVWHRTWTWADRRGRGDGVFEPLARFALANGAVSLVGNVLLVHLLVGAAHIPLLPASLLAIAACGVVNYLLVDRLVFTGRQVRERPVHTP